MPTLQINGSLHTYDLTGRRDLSSSVLVFVHGWLLSRAYWQPLIEQLSPCFQCLSYDLRGFGESHVRSDRAVVPTADPTDSAFSPLAFAQDLSALLDSLGIDRAWLVGHSLGGAIALSTAEICPDRVAGVTCLNAGGGIYIEHEFHRFRQVGRYMVKARRPWFRWLPLLDWMFWKAGTDRPLASMWRRQRFRDFLGAESQAALGALLQSTTQEEVHRLPQVVQKLRQPVYFMGGDKDPIMETRYVRHLASYHALFQNNGENWLEIPDCGHLAMLEQTDWVAEKLRELVSQHTPAFS